MMRAVNMAEWDTEKDEIVRGYYDLLKTELMSFYPSGNIHNMLSTGLRVKNL